MPNMPDIPHGTTLAFDFGETWWSTFWFQRSLL